MKKTILIILVLIGINISYSQCGCTKVVVIVDNSGSISTTEFTQIKRSIDSVSTKLLRLNPSTKISVIQYATQSSANHHYNVSVPFTSNPVTARTWNRAYGAGGTVQPSWFQDHLPGSMYQMRKDGIWYRGNSVDLETDSCNILMFLFTDALFGGTGSGCCSNLSNVGTAAPLALSNFGEYNWHKTNFNSNWSVFQVSYLASNYSAGAAIANKGGGFTGTIATNPGDPEGSGGPRKLITSSSFIFTQPIVDTLIKYLSTDSSLKSFSYISDTICANDSLLFSGIYLKNSGIYLDTFTNSIGCDSVQLLRLMVIPINPTTFFNTICQGDSILFKGVYLKSSGIYYDTLSSVSSCDSTIVFNLVVSNPINYSYFDTICSTDSLLFSGIYLKSAGIYYDTVQNVFGCDSAVALNLRIKTCPTIGVNNLILSSNTFTVFPNPAKSNITISTDLKGEMHFYIMNVSGKVVQKGKFRYNKNIDASNLKNGTYLIKLIDKEGKQFVNQIVVSK